MAKRIRCYMSESVFYQLTIEVEDDADEDAIAAAAEAAFVQGHYEECGQDDRTLDDWEAEEVPFDRMPSPDIEEGKA